MVIASLLRWGLMSGPRPRKEGKGEGRAVVEVRGGQGRSRKRRVGGAEMAATILIGGGGRVAEAMTRAAWGKENESAKGSGRGTKKGSRGKKLDEAERVLRAVGEALVDKEGGVGKELMRGKSEESLRKVLREAVESKVGILVRLAAVVLVRLSASEACREMVAVPRYLSIVESILKIGHARGKAMSEARKLAAKTIRNLTAYSEKSSLVIGKSTTIVKLLLAAVKKGGPAEAEAAAAVANLARHGLPFQAYISKHKGLSVLVKVVRGRGDPTAVYHSMRALSEFSLEPRWQVLMITEGVIPAAVDLIESCPDVEIVSEATRFIGNIAAERVGREATTAAGGLEVLSCRVASMVKEKGGVYEFALDEKEVMLAADLFRAMANVCVGHKEATRRTIAAGGLTALVAACDTEKTDDLLKVEAFRGLLIIAQAGSSYRAAVLREISVRIKEKVAAGKLYDRLYDLCRRIKVEACADRKDEAPETVAGLSEMTKRLIFGSVSDNARTLPESKSEASRAFRPSGRVLSVAKPLPRRKRKGDRDHNHKELKGSAKPPSSSRVTSNGHVPESTLIDSGTAARKKESWVASAWSSICTVIGTGVEVPPDLDGDQFEIGKPLGRGGYATVYLAKNRKTRELVAIKRFHPPCSSLPNAKEVAKQSARRALKERHIWEGLFHKNIVSYLGCFFDERGSLNLVAEYVRGWSLADYLAHYTKFPEHLVAQITNQIVDGLDYLHRAGVTHRDLKPANILIDHEGTVKITDFGVSSALDVPTMTGNTLVGTPWYIAPEMIEGRAYGKSVDVWSLGCTVLELATGRRPYHNLKAHQALFKMVSDRMPPIPDTLSPVCRDFLKTCWVWKPEQRPYPTHLRRHPFLANARSQK